MKKHHVLLILVLALIAILVVPFGSAAIAQYTAGRSFVSSQYSKYCYHKGYENKNIRERMYFSTLEECAKPLKK